MNIMNELLVNNERYAGNFAKGRLPMPPAKQIAVVEASPYVPHKDQVRGFIYDVETGRLREVD